MADTSLFYKKEHNGGGHSLFQQPLVNTGS